MYSFLSNQTLISPAKRIRPRTVKMSDKNVQPEYTKSAGPAKISNVQRRGKFSLDILSGEWKLKKRPAQKLHVAGHFKSAFKNVRQRFSISKSFGFSGKAAIKCSWVLCNTLRHT